MLAMLSTGAAVTSEEACRECIGADVVCIACPMGLCKRAAVGANGCPELGLSRSGKFVCKMRAGVNCLPQPIGG